MNSLRGFIGRAIRATELVLRDRRIPKPLRWIGGIALLPIPGPVDEIVLVLLAPVLLVLYRRHMREAWNASGSAPPTVGGAGVTPTAS